MQPQESRHPSNAQTGKLSGKVALINDAHTGIGLAVAELFAHEGAEVAISCFGGEEIQQKHRAIEGKAEKCLLFSGDPADIKYCIDVVERTLVEYGGLDILVNSTVDLESSDYRHETAEDRSESQIATSLGSTVFMTQSVLFYLGEGGSIINTIPISQGESASTAVDCIAARFSLTNFTCTLAKELVSKQIRVNGVGVRPSNETFPRQSNNCMRRKVQPEEIAPSYLFLASRDSSQMTGQVLYPNCN